MQLRNWKIGKLRNRRGLGSGAPARLEWILKVFERKLWILMFVFLFLPDVFDQGGNSWSLFRPCLDKDLFGRLCGAADAGAMEIMEAGFGSICDW